MRTILLWPLAFCVAMGFLVSGRRKSLEARVLRGKMSPKLLRMVVLILVALGAGKRAEAQAQPATTRTNAAAPFGGLDMMAGNTKVVPLSINGKKVEIEDHAAARSKDFPAPLTGAGVQAWAFDETSRGIWSRLQALVSELRSKDKAIHDAGVKSLGDGFALPEMKHFVVLLNNERPVEGKDVGVPLEDVTAAAQEMAAAGMYNVWGTTYLWGKTPLNVKAADVDKLAACYTLLEDCLRADNALRLAQAQVGPIVVTGWMSKAAPTSNKVVLPANYLAAAEQLFATSDAGLFETEGAISFSFPATKSGAMLLRRGQKFELGVKDFVRLRRLDILLTGDAPVTVTHRLLGEMVLPANTVVTARNVETFLNPDARKKMAEWTAAALDGDSDALQLLEMVLPAAATSMREALATKKDARGAAAVRMVLQEFDGE